MQKALLEYTDKQVEIEDLHKRIEKLEKENVVVTDSVKGSYKEFPFTQHNITIKGMEEEKLKKINRLRNILSRQYDSLLEKQTKLEEKIEKIDNTRIRTIIRLKFIDKKNWTQIAHTFNTTVDCIKKEYSRYINKF